jgi:feruloyl esterase
VDAVEKGNINAMDPNLKPFISRGGKLIQYHGWADQQIPPGTSPEYYTSVTQALGGADKVKNNYRLFMVPGWGHCGGGDGTHHVRHADGARAVGGKGQGAGPDSGVAVVDGRADRTRPLCLYPQVAAYKGSGNTEDEARACLQRPLTAVS